MKYQEKEAKQDKKYWTAVEMQDGQECRVTTTDRFDSAKLRLICKLHLNASVLSAWPGFVTGMTSS